MIFYDAQIDLRIETHAGLDADLISLQRKEKLLLVHGRRGKQRCFDAVPIPLRDLAICLRHLMERLDRCEAPAFSP